MTSPQAKPKRASEPEESPIHTKRPRTSVAPLALGVEPAVDGVVENQTDPLTYWIQKEGWPKEYFNQDEQTRQDLEFGKDGPFEQYWGEPEEEEDDMDQVLDRKRSASAISATIPSSQKPKRFSYSYTDPRYETFLATKGSFMCDSDLGIIDKSQVDCQTLLSAKAPVPHNSLFRKELFETICKMMQGKNEARLIRDISPLIVPSPEILAAYGATNLRCLAESTNESWTNAIILNDLARPQPDSAVGFKREVFTEDQLNRLDPLVGDLRDTSFFMGTCYMYFPFLTCEIKCGAAALDIADRQNAHSMTVAVRGVVELFRMVKREKELDREILAFSISHNSQEARIYGHYPVIDRNKTTFYRYPIRKFSFAELDGKEKWTAYKFTKNVYNIWMPTHLKRICSVIDMLPLDPNFEVSELPSEFATGFSDYSGRDAASILEEAGSQSGLVGSRDDTLDTSLSWGGDAFPKPKKRARLELFSRR